MSAPKLVVSRSRQGETVDPLTLGDRTQAGNANLLAQVHYENFRYVRKWNAFIVWDAALWHRDEGHVRMFEIAKDVGAEWLHRAIDAGSDKDRDAMIAWGRTSLSRSGIRDMVDLARGLPNVAIDHDTLDADPWLWGASNGVIDLKTGLLRNAERADLITRRSPIAYDPGATAPRFERALAEWFPDDDVREYVQRLAGAAMLGKQADHVFVIHFGTGRNGKGTFCRAMLHVFGPYGVTPHLSLLVQTRHSEHDTIKAELFRARLAIASETERRVRLAEASVKNLTGGDAILCRRMHENPWSFTPSHSLWLQTNYLPEIAGRDRGIWSRIRVVPWVATFEAQPERDLDDALRAEGAGILAWAVRGCLAWQKVGLTEPEAVVRATMAYRTAADVCGRFATDCNLRFDATLRITAVALGAMLEEWAGAEGLRPNRGDFSDWLKEHGAKRVRQRTDEGNIWYWLGIGVSSTDSVPTVPAPSTFFLEDSLPKKSRTQQEQQEQLEYEDEERSALEAGL